MPQIVALSIARPLYEGLSNHPFTGYVLGRFKRAVNLIDSRQRIVALTTPDLGNGPFSIVIEANPAFFSDIDLKQPVSATARLVVSGSWHLDLRQAKVWEPRILPLEAPRRRISALSEIVETYGDWPRLTVDTPATRRTAQLARQAARALNRALVERDNLEPAVKCLAGLGNGLTPAGDDYLVGVMAALWLRGERILPATIAQIAAPQTTALSAAFLLAAGRGEFIEPWHQLVQSLRIETDEAVRKSVERIAKFGASSGTDALAGFAATIIGHLCQQKSQP